MPWDMINDKMTISKYDSWFLWCLLRLYHPVFGFERVNIQILNQPISFRFLKNKYYSYNRKLSKRKSDNFHITVHITFQTIFPDQMGLKKWFQQLDPCRLPPAAIPLPPNRALGAANLLQAYCRSQPFLITAWSFCFWTHKLKIKKMFRKNGILEKSGTKGCFFCTAGTCKYAQHTTWIRWILIVPNERKWSAFFGGFNYSMRAGGPREKKLTTMIRGE